MGKRRMLYFIAGFGALILAVIVLLAQGGTRRSGEIVLAQPAADSASESAADAALRLCFRPFLPPSFFIRL